MPTAALTKAENKELAGAGGIEPPNAGIKIRCLTAWRRPNSEAVYSCFVSREQSLDQPEL